MQEAKPSSDGKMIKLLTFELVSATRIFLFPSPWMGYYSTAGLTSAVNLPVPIHTAESSKALSEKCLVQEHSTVAPSRLEPAGPLDTESKALSTRKLGLPYCDSS